jgi:O-antigen/teichoic acid export membrane protein
MYQVSVLQALKKFALSMGGQIFFFFLLLIVAILLSLAMDKVNIDYILLGIGVVCLTIVALQRVFIKLSIPQATKPSLPEFKQKKEWSKSSLQMMVSSILILSVNTINLVMLEILGVHENDVAHFAIIITITSAISAISAAVEHVIDPMISPAVEKNDKAHLQYLINITNVIKLAPTILMTLAIVIFGKQIRGSFGSAYVSSYLPLVIMTLAFLAYNCVSASFSLLIFSGNQPSAMMISLVELTLLVLLNVLLIPRFHLMGAVYSFAISLLLAETLAVILVRKKLQIKPFFFI